MTLTSIMKSISAFFVLAALMMIASSDALASSAKDALLTEAMPGIESKVKEAVRVYDDVKMDVKGDEVWLRGHVNTQKEKDALESKIRNIPGVKYVHDAVTVKEESAVGEFLDDTAITAEVKGKVLARKGLDSLDISVKTVDGVVTLSGKVESLAQVELAEKTTLEVKGVKKVINALTVQK